MKVKYSYCGILNNYKFRGKEGDMNLIGIFMSHSSVDKPFARRIGNDLRAFGARVWIDEAEIKIGDSLIEKISNGINNTDYLIVILSNTSCGSEWVKREVNIAITKEILGLKIKVLPVLIDDCEIPLFLIDKKYADFRSGCNYMDARNYIIDSIGLEIPKRTFRFLDQHIFYDLTDVNNRFDVRSIRWYSESDFKKVLDRVEYFGLSIFGIEASDNGRFVDVEVHSLGKYESNDPRWYKQAFKKLLKKHQNCFYSASYEVPYKLLNKFITHK